MQMYSSRLQVKSSCPMFAAFVYRKGEYLYNNSSKEVQSYCSLLCTNSGFILGTYNNAFYLFAYKNNYLLEIKYCFPQG